MPPTPPDPLRPTKTVDEVIAELGLYPREAFDFVSRGLSYAVDKIHGPLTEEQRKAEEQKREKHAKHEPASSRHITGRQLCEGLREFALAQWGLLARTVLRRWNINRTEDFGRIVFALVDNGIWMKTDDDTIDEFKRVFDFATAFESGYRIQHPPT